MADRPTAVTMDAPRLLELSLAIGHGVGLELMLQRFLARLVAVLDLSAAIVQGHVGSERTPVDVREGAEAADIAQLVGWLRRTRGGVDSPLEANVHGRCIDLPGLGVLGLLSRAEFPPALETALAPIIEQLSDAIRARLAVDEAYVHRRRLQLASDSASIGVWTWHIARSRLEWDPTMFRIFDVDPDRFGNTLDDWKRCVHPDDLAETVKRLGQSLAQETLFESEFRIIDRTGAIRHIRGYAQIERDRHLNPVRLTGVNYDVSDLRHVQASLLHRSLFESLLIDLSVGLIGAQPEAFDERINEALYKVGRFVGADRAYLFLYDWEQGELTNTHEWVADGASPVIQQRQHCSLEGFEHWVAAHRGGMPMGVDDVAALNPDDPVRVLFGSQDVKSLITLPLRGGGSGCLGFVGFDAVRQTQCWASEDVALLSLLSDMLANVEIKRLQAAQIADAQAQLQRSARLAQQAAERATAASRAKSRFLANISHEIRTPMHVILGMADLLDEAELSAQQRQFLQALRSSGSSLMTLLNDVLDSARIESNQMVMEIETLNLRVLVEEVTALFRQASERPDLTFSVSWPDGLSPWVHADPQRVRQVLMNLLGNAVKFTPTGGITVAARAATKRSEAAGGTCVEVAVTDTGVGIPKAALSGIFEPFRQADESTTREYGGSGLGLAIVKELVERMDGTVSVDSRLGLGSCFRFSLPAAMVSGHDLQACAVPEPAQRTKRSAPLLPGCRVLLAEDQPFNQLLAEQLLLRLGCDVTVANDGPSALKLALSTPVDALLMDCQMPRMDGLEVTRRLRAQGGPNRNVPVIALTANAMPADRDACLKAGMDAFVGKPYTLEALAEVLMAQLRPLVT